MAKVYETRDLHPRVAHMLALKNWCAINEFRVKGGSIDFLAIERLTGQIAIVEVKVSVKRALPLVDQFMRYEEGLKILNTKRIAFVWDDVDDDVIMELDRYGVSMYYVEEETPCMPQIAHHTMVHEFRYWMNFWHKIDSFASEQPSGPMNDYARYLEEIRLWKESLIFIESPFKELFS